jgi:tetratricopeptide (TPR) repeat protein
MGGDGSEIDWFVGYYPPAENFQASLEKILKGDNTFQVLQAAYAKNPKDVAAVFGLARKWADRYDAPKAEEKYKEVIVLDPDGKAGSYTDKDTFITAPYTEHAKYYLADASFAGPKPDTAPLKAFIAENPQSRLVRQAYMTLASYHASRSPKQEAEAFFTEYAARFPDDPAPLTAWMTRIIRDKGPLDKGAEIAGRLPELTLSNPNPSINQMIARFYDLAGDTSKAGETYGTAFMERRVQSLASSLLAYAYYWTDKKENLESAKAMTETALKIGPNDVYALREAASVFIKAGDDARALEIFGPAWFEKKAAEKSGEDIYSYAQFWTRQGKNLDGALAAAKKAVEFQPKLYFFWSTLSDVYAKMGNKAEAIKALEKAAELAEGNAKTAMQKKLDALKGPASEKK